MLKRVSGLCALSLALGAMLLRAQDVFVLPGAGSSNGAVEAFTAAPLSKISTFSSGNGSFLVLPTVDATKFFVIADSSTQTVTATDSTFVHPTVVANLSAPATGAVITPDGRLLAVAAGTLHLFDTGTNNEIVPGGISQGGAVTTFDTAASLDSSAIFALGSTGSGTSQITAISTLNHVASATLTIPQVATAVAVGPNGLVYVSLPNEILELDPRTLKPTAGGTIGLSGNPGRLIFTPDGQFALAPNQSTLSGSLPLFIVALAAHTVTTPNLGLPPLTSLQPLGIDSFVALSGQGLYRITISNPVSVTQLQFPGITSALLALTASNEVPAAAIGTVQSIYALSSTTIYRINPASNAVSGQYPLPNSINGGGLSFATASITGLQARVASLLTYGTNQAILPSAVAAPLVVQTLDANNHPIMGVSVQFQSSSNGAALSSASATTGANGYALTYLTAPTTTGPITVTATVGTATANFNIDVNSSAGNANSPRLTILAGQGNLMLAETSTGVSSQYGSPLEILLTDSNGVPLPNIPVTFSVTSGGGYVVANQSSNAKQTVNTGANGTAQVDFLTTSVDPNNTTGFAPTTITASATVNGTASNSVVFYLTTVPQSPGPTVNVVPTAGTTLTGSEGGILPAGVSAEVTSPRGYGIPNVSLILNSGNLNPNVYPSATCNTPNGGVVLTNTNGAASCDVLFGPRIGMGTFTLSVGYIKTQQYQFRVTPAAPAVAQITQGNNQVGNPGQKLPLALVVHVTDSGGNIITGTPVSWQVLPAGAVTLSSVSIATDNNGNASVIATLGTTGGAAQVKVTAGAASATFNLTINVPSVGIQKVSGDQQTTPINTAFPLPLTVKVVDSANNGVPSVQVNFQVTSGVATLGSSSVTTDSTGQASTTVTAGATGGTIAISATSGALSVSFTLTAQLPGPSNITIVNGASFVPNAGISPGGIATISGTGFLTDVQGLVSTYNIVGPLPTTFSGVTITFDGTPAPIYYVQNANGTDQVTVQVPFEVQPGPAVSLVVSVTNGGSTTVTVPVRPLAPGVFTTVYGGKTYPVALRPDGSPVSPTNPAQQGENISVYVTGLGQTTPPTATGDAGIPNQSIAATMIIGINGSGVPLISADYAPGMVGVYVITLQVPAKTKTGPYQPLGVIAYDSANNAHFAQSTYIPIQ